jgi:hypothetical protein
MLRYRSNTLLAVRRVAARQRIAEVDDVLARIEAGPCATGEQFGRLTASRQ